MEEDLNAKLADFQLSEEEFKQYCEAHPMHAREMAEKMGGMSEKKVKVGDLDGQGWSRGELGLNGRLGSGRSAGGACCAGGLHGVGAAAQATDAAPARWRSVYACSAAAAHLLGFCCC